MYLLMSDADRPTLAFLPLVSPVQTERATSHCILRRWRSRHVLRPVSMDTSCWPRELYEIILHSLARKSSIITVIRKAPPDILQSDNQSLDCHVDLPAAY